MLAGLAAADEKEGEGPRSIGGLTFIDEVELTVVNVVAHVTTSSGKIVTDLTKDDFRIYQDGEPKPITNFHLYTEELYQSYQLPELISPLDAGTPERPPQGDEVLEPRPVYIVLYIDNRNIHPIERNRALSQMRDWVRQHVRPPVQMMVVGYQRSREVLQPFTSDPRKILEAIRAVRSETGGRAALESDRDWILYLIQFLQDEACATGTGTKPRPRWPSRTGP